MQTISEWWATKINENKSRDEINIQRLAEQGWRVLVIWGCELKANNREDTLNSLVRKLTV